MQYFRGTKCLSCIKYRAPVSSHSAVLLQPSTQSTQSEQMVYWDSLRLSAFVKATSTIWIEDSFTLFSLTHPEGTLTDNLLQYCSSDCNVSMLNSVEEMSFNADVQMPIQSMLWLSFYKLFICCCKEWVMWCGLIQILVHYHHPHIVLTYEGISQGSYGKESGSLISSLVSCCFVCRPLLSSGRVEKASLALL